MKHFLVLDAQNIRLSSVRLLLALAAILDFDVWWTDVRLAYFQSSESLSRNIFKENTEGELNLNKDKCL